MRAAAELAGETFPAVARLGSSLDFGVSGFPGLVWAGVWVREDLRVMRDPPVASAGLCVARGRGCGSDDGSCGETSPEQAVRDLQGPRLPKLSAKE